MLCRSRVDRARRSSFVTTTRRERGRWSREAGNTGRAKDAWEAFKRSRGPRAEPEADDPLSDVHAALVRVIAELREMGIAPPISLHRAIHALTYARKHTTRANE
jgi:hypothetical protein